MQQPSIKPTVTFVHNTQPTTSKHIKTPHHGPTWPLASSGFNFVGEWDCRTLHDWSWSPQHSDAFFMWTYMFHYYIDCYSVGHRWMRLLTKGKFFSEYTCFSIGRCVKSMHTDPICCPPIFFVCLPCPSSCFGIILDRGGGGMVTMFFVDVWLSACGSMDVLSVGISLPL